MFNRIFPSHHSDREIYDTFATEQSLQSLAFFVIALAVGSLFIYPLLHVSPSGLVPSVAPGPAALIARKLRARGFRPSPPPTPTWPTLGQLKHPAAYLLGSRRTDKYGESGAESEEFERILNSDSEEEEDRRLAQLFGRPRRRVPSMNV